MHKFVQNIVAFSLLNHIFVLFMSGLLVSTLVIVERVYVELDAKTNELGAHRYNKIIHPPLLKHHIVR